MIGHGPKWTILGVWGRVLCLVHDSKCFTTELKFSISQGGWSLPQMRHHSLGAVKMGCSVNRALPDICKALASPPGTACAWRGDVNT